MRTYLAALVNFGDHAYAGEPMKFKITKTSGEHIAVCEVDYDEESNALFDCASVNGQEIPDDLLDGFIKAFELFDIEDPLDFAF
jgi:hypothetical protein